MRLAIAFVISKSLVKSIQNQLVSNTAYVRRQNLADFKSISNISTSKHLAAQGGALLRRNVRGNLFQVHERASA
jgi:hypothetical protein